MIKEKKSLKGSQDGEGINEENPLEKHWIKGKGKRRNNGWRTWECKLVNTQKDLTNSGSMRAFCD